MWAVSEGWVRNWVGVGTMWAVSEWRVRNRVASMASGTAHQHVPVLWPPQVLHVCLYEGDSEGSTPLLLAARNGHLDVCRVLLQRGASSHCDPPILLGPRSAIPVCGSVSLLDRRWICRAPPKVEARRPRVNTSITALLEREDRANDADGPNANVL